MKQSFKIWTKKSGLAIIAAISGFTVASPASAQSYSFPTYAYLHSRAGVSSSGHALTRSAGLYNAAPAANPAELVVSVWPTSGNVNFQYCNPTSGSVTPNAATLNWRVTR